MSSVRIIVTVTSVTVIYWVSEKLHTHYQPWYQKNLISDEKTVEDWVKYPHDTSKYSLAVLKMWVASLRVIRIEDFGQIPWHVWQERQEDLCFVAGLRERDVLQWRKEFVKQQNSVQHRPKCGQTGSRVSQAGGAVVQERYTKSSPGLVPVELAYPLWGSHTLWGSHMRCVCPSGYDGPDVMPLHSIYPSHHVVQNNLSALSLGKYIHPSLLNILADIVAVAVVLHVWSNVIWLLGRAATSALNLLPLFDEPAFVTGDLLKINQGSHTAGRASLRTAVTIYIFVTKGLLHSSLWDDLADLLQSSMLIEVLGKMERNEDNGLKQILCEVGALIRTFRNRQRRISGRAVCEMVEMRNLAILIPHCLCCRCGSQVRSCWNDPAASMVDSLLVQLLTGAVPNGPAQWFLLKEIRLGLENHVILVYNHDA
ncbi:hypothetical protein C8J57DRAFT_1219535 [Mycena rebaudengoi]|nr:hypothetical protein C8J57DRAFT_1219535 [Mycena rebaudengoi]